MMILTRTGISIHALRGEGDVGDYSDKNGDTKFQSTPSVGRATKLIVPPKYLIGISIHALRGEGDNANNPHDAKYGISIHALRGEGDAFHIYNSLAH